jgi:hypothetical protein
MRGFMLASFSLLVFASTLIVGTEAAAAATPDQIHACRNRVMEQYPGTAEFNVGVTEAWTANGSVRLDWYNGPGRTGLCVVGPKNQMFQFVVNGQSQPPYNPGGGNGGPGQSLQSFGEVPFVGRFDAVNNSGSFANGVVLFQAYVNGSGPSQWGARCADGRLLNGNYANAGNGGNVVRDSAQARYVVAYVCNGGPPDTATNGLVNFGKVPNIGQFSVVNGSGQGGNGIVYFQAYVNGAGPQSWMTACGTGQLGQNGNYVAYSPQAQYVSSYICNGGPPGGRWSR